MRCVVFAALVAAVHARGRCRPETRCINSPDEGLTDVSEFFMPTNATAAEMAIYQQGVDRYSVQGSVGRRCLHGHLDLAGAQTNETRPCERAEGYCGWNVAFHMCTCVSPEAAQANYSITGYLVMAPIFIVFGIFQFVLVYVLDRKDDTTYPSCSDGAEAVAWYFLAALYLCIPIGLVGGGVACIFMALRDPSLPSTYGYFQGCGHYNFFNFANPGGRAFAIIFGSVFFIALVVCPVYALCIKPWLCPGPRMRRAREIRHEMITLAAAGSPPPRRPPGRAVMSHVGGSARDLIGASGGIALELATPARLARASTGRIRYNHGSLARPIAQTAVMQATVLKTGWMKRVVPSYIGVSKRMFYVLYDNQQLQYYDAEKEPPWTADCHGKLTLNSSIDEIKSSPQKAHTGKALSEFIFTIKIAGKAADWDVDAGDEATRDTWMEAIKEAVKPTVVAATALPAGQETDSGAVVVVSSAVLADPM